MSMTDKNLLSEKHFDDVYGFVFLKHNEKKEKKSWITEFISNKN